MSINEKLREDMKKLVEMNSEIGTRASTESREHKKLKKDSLQFVGNVYQFINWLDAEMKAPLNKEREKRIAKAVNELEMSADRFSHFTLSQSFEQIAKTKRKEK